VDEQTQVEEMEVEELQTEEVEEPQEELAEEPEADLEQEQEQEEPAEEADAEEPAPAPTWSRPRPLTEFKPPRSWTQIAHVNAHLWLGDIEVVVIQCDLKKAVALVSSLQNEWTKQHWADCVRVRGRYQVEEGRWFEIEAMSVANNKVTLVPSGPPRPMQLAMSLKEMGAHLGVGDPDEEEETTALCTFDFSEPGLAEPCQAQALPGDVYCARHRAEVDEEDRQDDEATAQDIAEAGHKLLNAFDDAYPEQVTE
jgi:hypothetical protein